MVEVAHLDAVGEQHPIPQPVETVGEYDLALGAGGHPVQINGAQHSVADAQVELVGVRLGEGVRLPERHVVILPDTTAAVGIRKEFERPR